MCQEYLLQFESSLVELAAENVKLERRIDLNTRYEESVSLRTLPCLVSSLTQALLVLGCVGNERQPRLVVPKRNHSKTDISYYCILAYKLNGCKLSLSGYDSTSLN
jgi:hypothetical protein